MFQFPNRSRFSSTSETLREWPLEGTEWLAWIIICKMRQCHNHWKTVSGDPEDYYLRGVLSTDSCYDLLFGFEVDSRKTHSMHMEWSLVSRRRQWDGILPLIISHSLPFYIPCPSPSPSLLLGITLFRETSPNFCCQTEQRKRAMCNFMDCIRNRHGLREDVAKGME